MKRKQLGTIFFDQVGCFPFPFCLVLSFLLHSYISSDATCEVFGVLHALAFVFPLPVRVFSWPWHTCTCIYTYRIHLTGCIIRARIRNTWRRPQESCFHLCLWLQIEALGIWAASLIWSSSWLGRESWRLMHRLATNTLITSQLYILKKLFWYY